MKRLLFVALSWANILSAMVYSAENKGVSVFSKAREAGRAKSALLVTSAENKSHEVELKANIQDFEQQIQPVIKKSCVNCHGPKKAKGKFRIDELNPDLVNGEDAAHWLEVYDVLSNDEMPPEDEPDYHLNDRDRQVMVEWIGDEMKKATVAQRNNKKHSSFRRMTKYEYNYALQDLLGLSYDFAKNLPPESHSGDGFKNSSDLLLMSAMQLEKYSSISLKALKQAVIIGDKPKVMVYQIPMSEVLDQTNKRKNKKKDNTLLDPDNDDFSKLRKKAHVVDTKTGKGRTFNWGLRRGPINNPDETIFEIPDVSPIVTVLPLNQNYHLDLGDHLPDEGLMRVRIRVGRKNFIENEFATLRVSFGGQTSNNANFSTLITKEDIVIKANSDSPEVIEFFVPLSEVSRNVFRKKVEYDANPTEVLTLTNTSKAAGRQGDQAPELHIDYIEVEAPYFKSWPTKAYQDIFVNSKNSKDEVQYGYEILSKFMEKAFRRPIFKTDVNPYLALFSNYRSDFKTFEETMLHVLSVVLASPDFLYITQNSQQKEQQIDAYELASRLSFFLWSSLPDEELLRLAKNGQLLDNKTLDLQIKRMLSDKRAKRFSQNFVEQWLALDEFKLVDVDQKMHQVNIEEFKINAAKEPVEFFNEMLTQNKSIMDILHSDYIVVNDYLARHYGIKGVYGPHFRPVSISQNSKRGGLLTTASVLSMNSDGKDSHPLKRGIWLLENILHDPPPPPPANVPEVDLTDPRILKMTLKERMKDHRSKPACISCHKKIDPWGIAFEDFDAVGKFRASLKGKPIDSSATLYNDQKLDGHQGVKQYLLMDRQDQFSRAMVHKLLSYALGRSLSFSDRSDVERIAVQFRKQEDRLADLISIIVKSEIFQSK